MFDRESSGETKKQILLEFLNSRFKVLRM